MNCQECCICYENVPLEAKTSCNHFVCKECISNICTPTCPICRKDPIESIYITKEILQNIREKYREQVNDIGDEFFFNNFSQNNLYNSNDRFPSISIFTRILPRIFSRIPPGRVDVYSTLAGANVIPLNIINGSGNESEDDESKYEEVD